MAKTDAPDVAYIYKAGLKGFPITADTKLEWRDDAQVWQKYEFGGDINEQPVDLQARNRLEILDAGSGSLAIFPPPHKFFFARENEVNLGYVYYRKDSDTSFSLGVMQPERGEAMRRGASLTKCGTAASTLRARKSTTTRFTTRLPAPCSAWPSTTT